MYHMLLASSLSRHQGSFIPRLGAACMEAECAVICDSKTPNKYPCHEIPSFFASHDIAILRLVRSLRVVRVIRLVTNIPGFDRILEACVYPARILGSVFILLAIGVYMFANLGVALFSSAELEVRLFSLVVFVILTNDRSVKWLSIPLEVT